MNPMPFRRARLSVSMVPTLLGVPVPVVYPAGPPAASVPPSGTSGSAWDGWSKDQLEKELLMRLKYFYLQTDGTMRFPNSAEGDLLKMVHALLARGAS